MSSTIYCRLLGQGVTLSTHAVNSGVMLLAMQNEELMKDQEIRNMVSMMATYLTVWNIGFQLAYFSLAFVCDFLTVTGKDSLISKNIRRFRNTFFSSLVVPTASVVFVVFWTIFLYDRELLFPEFIDKIFSFNSNLVMHFFILPAVVWEMVFLPRPMPKSHRLNVGIIVILYIVYIAFVHHTYYQRQLFPYPIFTMSFGTIYYPIFIFTVFFFGIAIYFLQWKLHSFLWGQETNNGKVKIS